MLKQYFAGLVVILVIFGICYLLLSTVTTTPVNPFVTLLAGLIIGHLFGFMVSSRTRARPAQQTASKETKTLYVGNLPFRTTRYELSELFQPFGKVHSSRIVIDKATRKPRGYGFVEMDEKGAAKAIKSLHGSSLAGRNLKVTEANERS